MNEESDGQTGRATLLRWLLGAIVLGTVVVIWRTFGGNVLQLAAWAERQGHWGMAAFVAGYAVAVTAFVPASLLTMSAGAIYGIWRGALLVFIGAVAGSSLAFVLARHVLRRHVERRLARSPRFEALDRAIGRAGFGLVFLLRLSPAFPFALLNYALGITRVSFPAYVLGSVGMLPATFMYVYYGRIAGELAGLSAVRVPRGPEYWAVLGAGLVATVAVTVMVTRMARRALHERLGDDHTTAARAD